MEYAIMNIRKERLAMRNDKIEPEEVRYPVKDIQEFRPVPINSMRIFFKNGTSRKIKLSVFRIIPIFTAEEKVTFKNKGFVAGMLNIGVQNA